MEDVKKKTHFIKTIIENDIKTGKHQTIITRFPPEPNGYLHVGHAKSICLNFGLADEFQGRCNLRFDDTNPAREDQKYIDSIIDDVHWLGFDWGEKVLYASDYFERLYEFAVELIKKNKAYVCSLSGDEIRDQRGTLTDPGQDSPYRTRSVEENLELFSKMRTGEFNDGTHVLRAKIDMASPNINMRDPVLYRIKRMNHPRTHDQWCIYPMYDFTHCLSDAMEGITHSLCTLEFEDHRPLYDWTLDQVDAPCHPRQIEFARMNLNFTVMSKRKIQKLVGNQYIESWDDPRLPTIAGLRRRGYTPESIRKFCSIIGVSKKESRIDMGLLENCIREDLNEKADRVMAVINPLKVVIENWPENETQELEAWNHPKKKEMGSRKITFSKEIFIEKEDFMENAPKKFFRLAPGREVRLRYAYFITCNKVIKDETTGEILELHCSYDPATKGGDAPDGRKVKGTLHWVSALDCLDAEVHLYDRLFLNENPEAFEDRDFTKNINPDSLVKLKNAKLETSLAAAEPGRVFQFERLGYFCLDIKHNYSEKPVFNRTVTLRDTWAKMKNKG
ncbi:MAG: glutamine--tRNA ligase/YqeY domain fusion protein [Thermodesulfobacteriota bacterium]|nr:glutamine--tRNA ligase/YqeY domain fusion protein [Thermodesulfobacteriota bacterium]